MKTKICFAAIAACLGTVCLGGCTKEEMAYQGETSKLKVITRTEGTETAPNEGLIYLFNNNGECTNKIDMKDLANNTAISTKPGKYKITAIGGDNLSNYTLPDKENATDSSEITLNEGKRLSDLLLISDSITLDEGITNQINLTLNREVLCIKEIKIEKVPTDVKSAEITIAPVYKAIKLNGKYTNKTDTLKFTLKKDATTGNWINKEDSVFSLPSSGNPTIKLTTASDSVKKEYTFETTKPLRKNYFVKLNITYNEGLKTYMCSSLTAPEWDGTDESSYTIDEGNVTTVDSVKTEEKKDTVTNSNKDANAPVAGKAYKGYFVVSATGGKAVLLCNKQYKDITNAEMMAHCSKQPEIPEGATTDHWRLATLDEWKFILNYAYLKGDPNSGGENYEIDIDAHYYYVEDNKVNNEHFDAEDVGRVWLKIGDKGERIIKSSDKVGFSNSFIYRPVIDISY